MRKAFLVLAAVVAGTTAYADKVTFSQTPAAVQKQIRARARRQRIEDIDRDSRNGQVTYEASWKDTSGNQQELLLSDKGQILRDLPHAGALNPTVTQPSSALATTTNSIAGFTGGQKAPLNWASETLQNQLRTMANGAQIRNFQKGQFQGQTAFEASYRLNGQNTTVVLGEDGKVRASSPANLAPTTTTTTTSAASSARLANAQQAPMNWASEATQNKFKQMANGASIENFQKGQYQGRTAYQGSFTQNGQKQTVIIGEDASVLNSSPVAVGAAPGSVSGTVK